MRSLKLILLFSFLPLIFALFQPLQDIDPALYAEVTREMAQNPSFIPRLLGSPYFDKPPLFFWIHSFPFHLFGISDWLFRLISLFVLLATSFYIYRIATKISTREGALLSVIFYQASIIVFVQFLDLKIDLLLTFFLAGAFFWGIENNPILFMVHASLGVLTKGPIGIVLPLSVAIIYFLFEQRQRWRKIAIYSFLSLVSLLPWFLYLYKLNDVAGWDAVRYQLFEQSFLRPFAKKFPARHTPLYFVHTILWAALPWTHILLFSIARYFRNWKESVSVERILILWAVIGFMMISVVRWKMPQYVLWILPPLSILSAKTFVEINGESLVLRLSHIFVFLLPFVILFLWIFFFFDEEPWFIAVVVSAFVVLAVPVVWYKNPIRFVVVSYILFQVLVALHMFPKILAYNPFIAWGKQLSSRTGPIYQFATPTTYALDYYSRKVTKHLHSLDSVKSVSGGYIVLPEEYLEEVRQENWVVIEKKPWYRTSKLSLKFLMKRTRLQTTRNIALAQLKCMERDRDMGNN